MKILITGVSGYVGSELALHLTSQGYEVYGVSRGESNVKIKEHFCVSGYDVLELETIYRKIGSIDIVIHLAASLKYFGSKEELNSSNVEITKNIVKVSESFFVKKIIYASSIEAAKFSFKNKLISFLWSSNLTNYGDSKRRTEEFLKNRMLASNSKIYILRIGSVFSGDRYTFISQILESIFDKTRFFYQLPIIGKYTVMPIHMDDLVDYISCLCGEDLTNGFFNLHYPPIEIREIFSILVKHFNVETFKFPRNSVKTFFFTILFHYFNVARRGYGDFTSYLLASGVFAKRDRRLIPTSIGEIDLSVNRCSRVIVASAVDNIKNKIVFDK